MPADAWDSIFAAELSRLSAGHLLRRRRVVRPIDAVRVSVDGRELVNFASNDYLGLARHRRVIDAARAAAEAYGVGSGAAPLVTGYTPAHAAAERAVAAWKGTDAAVLFPSGYQANVAVVQALATAAGRAGRPVRFLLDKLCHASLVDAVRAVADDRADPGGRPSDDGGTPGGTGASFRVFPHNGTAKLARLLGDAGTSSAAPAPGLGSPAAPPRVGPGAGVTFSQASARGGAAGLPNPGAGAALDVIVTESIFSMDGDAADLPAIARLKRRGGTDPTGTAAAGPADALLVLDEAHGSGVYGPAGAGLAAELGLSAAVDVTVVTLSKAVGVGGAAVCGSRAFCDLLVNVGRPYVFSTSVPPAMAAAAEAAVEVMRDEPDRQRRVRDAARHVRAELSAAGYRLPPGDSPIVPLVLGDEQAALAAADRLADRGLLVLAIRPPTVARGTSRLRVTLSSEHTGAQVKTLLAALRDLPTRASD